VPSTITTTAGTAPSQKHENIGIEAGIAGAIPAPESERLRIHFLQHRSMSVTAIPLLYCHTWPGSFLEITRCIGALVSPVETPTQTWRDQVAFHVIAPSLPGFGFSDASQRTDFGAKDTASVLVNLMERLGYDRFVVWGDGW
jgi:pimeloyl-ACP methyl ester carboxylesterase